MVDEVIEQGIAPITVSYANANFYEFVVVERVLKFREEVICQSTSANGYNRFQTVTEAAQMLTLSLAERHGSGLYKVFV